MAVADPLSTALDDFYKQVLLAPKRSTGRAGKRGGLDKWRGFKSNALAVHPKQVAAANARAKRHGISAHYDKKGTVHVGSRREHEKLLKLEGMHCNEDGGKGD
jgi:hypothetical protein